MGLFDFLKKKKEPEGPDPLHDLVLEKMRAGWVVDYDLRSWNVARRHRYDFDGDKTLEWELRSGDDLLFLERSFDDEAELAVSRKIPIGAIDGDVRKHIMEHDDPPERIAYKGDTFYMDESGAGYFYEDGQGEGQGFVYWTFVDESGERYLTIEQWGEKEFEASLGEAAEEYQFTNILPGETVEG